MIKLENIVKEYKTQGGTVPVLKDITLHVNKGEMLAVMGRSGSGKSTLLNMIGGLTAPTFGAVWIQGKFQQSKRALLVKKKTDWLCCSKLCISQQKDSLGKCNTANSEQ